MSEQAIRGLEPETAAIRELGRSLSAEEWALPSACWGWSVKDVFSHMSCIWHGFVDPQASPLPEFQDVEAENEIPVEKRREWSAKDVLVEYEEFCEQALDVLRSLQTPEARDALFPLGTLGSFPSHALANALMFDHFTHLRMDLLYPFGPVRREHPPVGDDQVRPAVEWMLAGLPTMCREHLTPLLVQPVAIEFTGPGGGSWLLRRDEEGGVSVDADPALSDGGARAVGGAESFIGWGTKRLDWRRAGVRLTGDEELAARVLDAINII